ncbi:MAG: alpha-L-arabinofuranosidase [Chitinophagaceae bacterium]|nr:MAG: alpha-L-arabinofuranosidase [Chitinophagaceae bacterium]
MRIFFASILLFTVVACSKKTEPGPTDPDPVDPSEPVVPGVDPAVAPSIGFFLDDWAPRSFTKPAFSEKAMPSSPVAATVTIYAGTIITKIPRSINGQNANSWMSQIVDQEPLMTHLKNLAPGVIRFPGGSISDVYFWNSSAPDKPATAPPGHLDADGNLVSNPYWYGKNNDSWTISVANYYQLLAQTGAQGMITVNYGFARYGTSADPVAEAAHLAADWVRFDNGRTRYWEIGNETNGTWEAGYRIDPALNQDGQPAIITGELYGKHAQVFIDSMKNAAASIGKTIFISAYLLEKEPAAWQTATDKGWNAGVLGAINNKADYYTIHSYYTNYQTNAPAPEILATATTVTTDMMKYVSSELTRYGAIARPVALTEWNITSRGSMQVVSSVNGMHAALLQAEAIKNKYGQASRWDLANGWDAGNDHGLFDMGDEPGGMKWNPRPAFYYLYYMQQLTGDRMIAASSTSSDLPAYGSSFSSGEHAVMIVNKSTAARTTAVTLKNIKKASRVYWYVLTGGSDNGEFSRKVLVNGSGPATVSGGPSDYKTLRAFSAAVDKEIRLDVPARSVVYLVIE